VTLKENRELEECDAQAGKGIYRQYKRTCFLPVSWVDPRPDTYYGPEQGRALAPHSNIRC